MNERLSLMTICFLSLLPFSNLIEIECELQTNFWTPFGSLKECLFRNVSSTAPHEPLSSVTNQFLNLNEVKSFYIYKSPMCFYIPFGIEKHFQQLDTLYITHSGLKTVTNEDLKPFKQLKGLYMLNNQIESLGKDFFIYNTELQEINLSDNKLQNFAYGILEPLISLKRVEIYRNPCIDTGALTFEELAKLKSEMREKCPPKIVVHKERSTIGDMQNLKNRIADLEKQLEIINSSFKRNLANICQICDDLKETVA